MRSLSKDRNALVSEFLTSVESKDFFNHKEGDSLMEWAIADMEETLQDFGGELDIPARYTMGYLLFSSSPAPLATPFALDPKEVALRNHLRGNRGYHAFVARNIVDTITKDELDTVRPVSLHLYKQQARIACELIYFDDLLGVGNQLPKNDTLENYLTTEQVASLRELSLRTPSVDYYGRYALGECARVSGGAVDIFSQIGRTTRHIQL